MGIRSPDIRDACGVRQQSVAWLGRWSTSLSCTCVLRFPPFFDEHQFKTYEKVLEGRVDFPKFVNLEKPAM